MRIYLLLRFHLSYLLRQHAIAFPLLMLLTLATVGAAGFSLYFSRTERGLDEAVRSLRKQSLPVAAATPAPPVTIPNLPEFSSSAFIEKFQSLVKDVNLTVDEVSYSLETGKTQPYWRYRIALKVQSGYPTIRKFLAALSSEFPNVIVDGVRCDRENSATANLTCELALSALFLRNDHG